MHRHDASVRPSAAGPYCYLRLCFMTLILMATLALPQAWAQSPNATFASVTAGLEKQEGYIPFWWDEAGGKVYLELSLFDADVLYYVSAATGGGSVELGLDRGLMDSTVIHFQRSGPRVLVVQQNVTYNAHGGSDAAARNVADAFPTAVLAALPILAVDGTKVLVDGTPLFIRDAAGVASRASRVNQGSFRFDANRSGFYPARMKAFPENTEIETISTFEVQNPGVVVRAVAAAQDVISMRIHHSFLKAPEGYVPREGDPRIGIGGRRMRNQAAPFDDSTEMTWISRWRLEKKDPSAALSEPVKPIIVYLDLAIPEPIRSAARAGLLWWNKSFEAAGFLNAIEVRDPTPDMDPMDSRYAWMLWIDRDERGFSSGGGFSDPRTGEILSPKTRMDSHRIRTLANYWEAYMAATEGYAQGPGGYPPGQEALVTLRYASLTAHEFGHSLGFGHNWAASVDERSSVMDYPIPRVKVVDGKLDLSEAYAEGIGSYDTYMVRYAYSEFEPQEEKQALDSIIAEMRAEGIQFVADTDPRWSWYDDRGTPTEFLNETMSARKIMLAQYGPDILQPGEPLGALRDMRMWMTYLHHRWAIEAAQKYVGGMYHNIVVKGETLPPTEIVPAALQREVLSLLMDAIQPANMALPESLLVNLTPHPGSNMEDLADDYAFDQLRAARILSGLVIGPLLDPDRAKRLLAFAARDPGTVTLPELVQTLLDNTWFAPAASEPGHAALLRVTQSVALDSMMLLASSADTSPEARNYLLMRLTELGNTLGGRRERDPLAAAHYQQSARSIARFLEDPKANVPDSVMIYWGDRPRSRWPMDPGPPL
jgi:hypothetical protein